jgi:hypothetical protein
MIYFHARRGERGEKLRLARESNETEEKGDFDISG